MPERLTQRAITPMKQSYKTSCVPSAISMVFSGFGVDISEQRLVDDYFPSAKNDLTLFEEGYGVDYEDTVKGIVQVINDLGLNDVLQLDVFAPPLYKYTSSPEKNYIVKASPRAAKRYSTEITEGRTFFETLEQLSRRGKIRVYSANARMIPFSENIGFNLPQVVYTGFYNELSDFIRQGHIIGPHGGGTRHVRVLDGTRIERLDSPSDQEGFIMLDPAREKEYAISPNHLIMLRSDKIRGDTFDYLFRISLKTSEQGLPIQSFREFLQSLRYLTP